MWILTFIIWFILSFFFLSLLFSLGIALLAGTVYIFFTTIHFLKQKHILWPTHKPSSFSSSPLFSLHLSLLVQHFFISLIVGGTAEYDIKSVQLRIQVFRQHLVVRNLLEVSDAYHPAIRNGDSPYRISYLSGGRGGVEFSSRISIKKELREKIFCKILEID